MFRRPWFTVLAAFALGSLALAACGGDGDSADSAPATTETADSGNQVSDQPSWTDADLDRLITVPVEGYTITNANRTEFGNATAVYLEDVASSVVPLSATVLFQPCDPFICVDLAAEVDDRRRENARSLLPVIHLENPGLVEQIENAELGGRPSYTIYFRSFVDQDNGQATALSYTAITHDGANLVNIRVGPDFASAGGLADSAEELAERMSPEQGAAVAADIIEALSGELG